MSNSFDGDNLLVAGLLGVVVGVSCVICLANTLFDTDAERKDTPRVCDFKDIKIVHKSQPHKSLPMMVTETGDFFEGSWTDAYKVNTCYHIAFCYDQGGNYHRSIVAYKPITCVTK